MTQPDTYSTQAQRLWEMTQTDWHISMVLTLTEPVCSFVSIYSDDDDLPSLRDFIGTDDANESIQKACDYMLENLGKFYAEHPDKNPPQ